MRNSWWMVNSGGSWVREGNIRACQLFRPWQKHRRRLTTFHTTDHNLFHYRLTTERHALQTISHLCWISRKGMKTTTSLPQLCKGDQSNKLPWLQQRGERAAGCLFHAITSCQHWPCSTNKTSGVQGGGGAAEELRLSGKEQRRERQEEESFGWLHGSYSSTVQVICTGEGSKPQTHQFPPPLHQAHQR